MDSDSLDNTHFLKQRRNLMIISLLIIFYKVGEADFSKPSFLGNEVTLEKPEAIPFFLSVFLVYFSLRYYTAFREEGCGRDFIEKIHTGVKHNMYVWAHRKIVKTGARMDTRKSVESGWVYVYKYGGSMIFEGKEISSSKDGWKLQASKKRIASMWLIAILDAIFRTSQFTTMLLPFFLATLAGLEFSEIRVVGILMDCFTS
jgi:hypothetical protein